MGEGAFHDLTLRDVVTIFKCKNTHSNGLTKNTQITVIHSWSRYSAEKNCTFYFTYFKFFYKK